MREANERKVRIDYVPISEIRRAPKNAKLHDLDELEAAFERFGFTTPVLLNETTGTLVAGHGRLEALERRKRAGKAPPAGVRERKGEWLVPVVRGVAFRDEAEAAAYLLADNRTTELGGYDRAILADLVREIEEAGATLEGTGWDQGALDAILADAVASNGSDGAPPEGASGPLPSAPPNRRAPPEDFPSFDETIQTEHKCPKCNYRWSGKSS